MGESKAFKKNNSQSAFEVDRITRETAISESKESELMSEDTLRSSSVSNPYRTVTPENKSLVKIQKWFKTFAWPQINLVLGFLFITILALLAIFVVYNLGAIKFNE